MRAELYVWIIVGDEATIAYYHERDGVWGYSIDPANDGEFVPEDSLGDDMKVISIKDPLQESHSTPGWLCPRCGRVNSPFKMTCDCSPLTESASALSISIGHDDVGGGDTCPFFDSYDNNDVFCRMRVSQSPAEHCQGEYAKCPLAGYVIDAQ